jgi:hypothetical protein
MIDRPREEAAVAIRDAHRAGIRVIIITGYHPRTASRIAVDLGIVAPGAAALDRPGHRCPHVGWRDRGRIDDGRGNVAHDRSVLSRRAHRRRLQPGERSHGGLYRAGLRPALQLLQCALRAHDCVAASVREPLVVARHPGFDTAAGCSRARRVSERGVRHDAAYPGSMARMRCNRQRRFVVERAAETGMAAVGPPAGGPRAAGVSQTRDVTLSGRHH